MGPKTKIYTKGNRALKASSFDSSRKNGEHFYGESGQEIGSFHHFCAILSQLSK